MTASSSDAPWTLIPTCRESVEARTLRGWTVEGLAQRAGISVSALEAFEAGRDMRILGDRGLIDLRRAFETEGIVFNEDGIHEVGADASRPYDQTAEAKMLVHSFLRFAELHTLQTMVDRPPS